MFSQAQKLTGSSYMSNTIDDEDDFSGGVVDDDDDDDDKDKVIT